MRFLREHRPEWADYNVDAYSSASVRNISYACPNVSFSSRPSRQVIIPLAKASEYDEVWLQCTSLTVVISLQFVSPRSPQYLHPFLQFLEVVRIEGQPLWPGDLASSHDMHLLQVP